MFTTSGPTDPNSASLNQSNMGALLQRSASHTEPDIQANAFQRQGQGQMDIDSIEDPSSAGLDPRRF